MIVVVALGINQLLVLYKNRQRLLLLLLSLIYIFQFGNFAQDYFLRNPFYHESQFQLSSRLLSRYLVEESKAGREIIVIGADPNGLFRQYILYSGLFDRLSDQRVRRQIAVKFQTKTYSWDNVTFTADCELASFSGDKTMVHRPDKPCQRIYEFTQEAPIGIAHISDSGKDFWIYFGKTCRQYDLPKYIRQVNFSDLQVEKISLEKYCQTFFEID